MTKATEIKFEDDRKDLENNVRDSRRGMKLVQTTKISGKGRSLNIGLADNIFTSRVSMVERPGSMVSGNSERRSAIDTSHGSRNTEVPGNLRTLAAVGIFIVAGALGFLIGRRRD